MKDNEILKLLKETGAVKSGHFKLSSGLHAGRYFQCALALADPAATEKIGRAIAEKYNRDSIDVVVSPAIGGLVLGFAVALAMGKKFIWAERAKGEMVFRRGFALDSGERVLIVEDVVTTGGSVAEVMRLAETAGAKIIGVACLINRGGKDEIAGVKLKALVTEVTEAYEPENCPLCRAGKSIEIPGSRCV
ncbi:MAG: orotate phosphoribosyltransferase [Actinomycetota bacterium]